MILPCLEPLQPTNHIDALQTPRGEREVYASVLHCNRCGACLPTCPSYQFYKQEIFSPRGRNQLLRLAFEGKIKLDAQDPLLISTLRTCILCGRCRKVCAGEISTAEHVLEMRRALHKNFLPRLLYSFLHLRTLHPKHFARVARLALLIRRTGILWWLWVLQITRIPALSFLSHLRRILPEHPMTLQRTFAKEHLIPDEKNPKQIYMPSLEAEFLLPQIACKTFQFAQKKARTAVWQNTPCGLFEYIYGDLRRCRLTVRRLIQRYEKAGKIPLITDSIDVYYFLKRAPQLFAKHPHMAQRARTFATQVKFVTDILPKPKRPSLLAPVQLEQSSLFEQDGQNVQQIYKFLFAFFGQNLLKCDYTNANADVPAFGYSFVDRELAEWIGKQAVEKWTRTHTKGVVVLSGLAALEVSCLLKRFYPQAKVAHVVEIAQNR